MPTIRFVSFTDQQCRRLISDPLQSDNDSTLCCSYEFQMQCFVIT